ncbi:MAG: transglycosylase SLT domain-containing protein [Rikenellaceae bacterium]
MTCKHLLLLIIGATLSVASHAVNFKNDVIIVDDHQKYDSLLSVWYKNNIVESYDNFVNEFIDIDLEADYNPKESLPDSVFKQRLDMLATAIQLPYNPIVKKYIDVYTVRNRIQMARLMGLAQYYMPIFEQELDLQGVPDELKIIPIIESALNPKAMSRVGAGGLWQFMMRTGKSYGLEINSFIDERFDPVKSTKVACAFMKDMYKIYGDWTLVIAAYNCGPGNVNKAIKRAGDAKTYWDIYEYLPRETRNHIPAFIAATYAYTFHKAHGIEPIKPPHTIATDTIMVNKMLHFGQISSTLNIPIDVIRSLNPQYKIDIIPAKEKKYALVLPIADVIEFASKEKQIYAKEEMYLADYQNINDETTLAVGTATKSTKQVAKSVTYKVKNGDNLGSIARKYSTTSQKIMKLNGIRDPRKLRIGQVLKVK